MPPGSARSVLIVEDERIVAKDLQQTLAAMGYDAFAIASNGDDAIRRVTERCPDVILMDIRIQGQRDGIETARLLRERFDIPMVYLTAHADDATIARAKTTEPYGYLLKPVKPAELRSAIEVALYRHEMERRLRERERWFSTTLRSIADAVITVDLSGHVTFMNPVAEQMIGTSVAQALGQPARDVLRLLDRDPSKPVESSLEKALRENRASSTDATMITANDGHRQISDSASPVSDNGELLGAVMVFRDVTEQRVMHRRLEVADRLASLGTMASGVAHQINNPLAVVIANGDYISDQLDEIAAALRAHGGDLARDLVARIEDVSQVQNEVSVAGSRIAKIVSDLRAFSLPPEQPSGEADVARAIEWAVRTTAHCFRARANLVVDVVAPLPPAQADELRLGQVFVNLLMNAGQAVPPGSAHDNEVRIHAHAERRRIVVEVHDTGPGIPPSNLHRIFEPFFTTKDVNEGTGLGLSVCHGIVTSLGGELLVESEVGKGSTFRVILRSSAQITLPPPVATRPARPARRARILVVDEDTTVHRTIKRLLRDHDLICTNSPQDALAILARGERFDVVFAELVMSAMTGMELYEHLLASAPELAGQLVFVTGGARETPRIEDFLRSVPNLALEKPFRLREVEDVLARVLGGA